jgi:NAD(P)-dependent dehydrogenase (short-subunit alcohol dehydrogenase family)
MTSLAFRLWPLFSSQGIGLYTVLNLAKHGAKVYLGARNEDKAKTAIQKLRAEGLGDKAGECRSTPIDKKNIFL